MARTALPAPQQITGSLGVVPVFTAADQVNGMSYPAKSGRVLWIRNASTTVAVTVTIGSGLTLEGVALPARADVEAVGTASVPSDLLVGPVGSQYVQPGTGLVNVDFSTGVSVSVALLDVSG